MASYRFGSVVPQALDSFSQAYQGSRRLASQEQANAIREALAIAQLRQLAEEEATRKALGGDIAAVTGALPAPGAPPTVADPRALRALPPAEPPIATPDAAYGIGADAADPLRATYEQPMPTPMTVAPRPSLPLPPESMMADPTGVTMRQLVEHPQVGGERVGRMMRTPEGRAALGQAGMVTEEEFQLRQTRKQAKLEAARKFAEANDLFASGDPEKALQGLNVEAAALNLFAQAVDRPEGLLKQAEERREEYRKAYKSEEEKKKIARDMPRLMGAFTKWVEQPDAPATTTAFFEALASMESEAGQKRADQLSAKLAEGLIERVKRSPTAAFDQALAQVVETRRKQGGEMDLNGVYQEAAKRNPGAFAQYLNYVMVHAREIPKPLLKMLGMEDVPSDIAHEADAIVTQVEKIPRGSGAYYKRLSEVKTTLTKERQPSSASQDRLAASQERTADVQLRRQLQDDVERLERELEKVKKDFGETTNLEQRLAQAKEDLKEHDARLRGKGYLGVTGDAKDKPAAPRPRVKANAPPKAPTKDDAKAEMKRLMDTYGLSLDATKELMRREGWK